MNVHAVLTREETKQAVLKLIRWHAKVGKGSTRDALRELAKDVRKL